MRPFTRILQRVGLGSYRGRYLWLTLSLTSLLIVVAIKAQDTVRESATQTTRQTALHASAISNLTEAEQHLHRLKQALLSFVLDPNEKGTTPIVETSAEMQRSLDRLTQNLFADIPGYHETLEDLNSDSAELRQWVEKLISIRLDTNQWVPASRTMQEQLAPQTRIASGTLQVIDTLLADVPDSDHLRLKVALLRVQWLHVVGEMRLMIANRFGAFSEDPIQGVQSRTSNLEIHLQRFQRDLHALIRLADERGLSIVLNDLVLLQGIVSSWARGFQRLRVLLTREGWRQDLVLLNGHINPLIERMSQHLVTTRLHLQSNTQNQLLALVGKAESLASDIGWLTLVLILLFGFGYFAYKRWLLQPIEHISEQLEREGRGEGQIPCMPPAVLETRQLMQSFSEMHAQVQARERRLDYMAYHDPLTGLPNRVLFHERLNDALHNELPRGHDVGVLFMDLDRFKQINDTHGHLVGDKFLVEVAHRLRSVFRSEDLVARLSGDEFAVLLQRFGQTHELSLLARKAIDALAAPYDIDGISFRSSASVGMSIAPLNGSTADRLIQQADTAMYHAKANGRSKFAQFRSDMLEQSAAQLALENDLHQAFTERQFQLFSQPVLDCSSLAPYAHECLIRWQHPKRGLLLPADFLSTIEDMGLIRDMTDWILDQLEETGATLDTAYTINLSALQLGDAGFLSHLQNRIKAGEIRAENLIIEITEDTLSDDLDRITLQLADLQAIGVRIALDDFGTGQSSLSHLRAFPFDTVKIDRSFVRDIADGEQDANLIRAIIRLAHTLGMEVVAEGVETREQHSFLRTEGCDLVQGFLLGRPTPLREASGNILDFSLNPC